MKFFKFNIAFENEVAEGYVTEKLIHSFIQKLFQFIGVQVKQKMILIQIHLFISMIMKVKII